RSKFTGMEEQYTVALARTGDGDKKFDTNQVNKVFDVLSEQTCETLEIPDSIPKTSVEKALKSIKGKEIELYDGTIEATEYDQDRQTYKVVGKKNYNSLYPVNNNSGGGFIKPTNSVSELTEIGYKEGDVLHVNPIGINVEKNTKYFKNNKPYDAKLLEGSETRYGF